MRSSWNGRRALLTGHTGLNDGSLSFWLAELGAQVSALALAPNTDGTSRQMAAEEQE